MRQKKRMWLANLTGVILFSNIGSVSVAFADGSGVATPANLVSPAYEMQNHPLPETTFTLIFDTHMHGSFGDPKQPENIANKFGIVNQIKSRYPNSLFVGNGDDMATSVFTATTQGQNMVDAFNAGKLDIDTFGNHDFDMGPDRLKQLIKESRFTWVSANVIDKRTNDVFGKEEGAQRFVIRRMNGVNVGITGLTEEDAPQLTSMGDNVRVLNPVEAMKAIVPQMKAAGADIIIVTSHLASPDARSLAQNVSGIDVIVGDHAAQDEDRPEMINGTLLWFIGDNFKHVGQINLYVKNGKIQDFNYHKFNLKADAKADSSTADPAVKTVMDRYYQQLSKDLAVEIGTTTTPIDVTSRLQRSAETAIGDFAADIMRQYANSDAAILNGGGIRANRMIPAGPLTKKDVMDVFPFPNVVVKLAVTGDQLYQALENGVSQVEKGAGRFPQVSGIQYSYNPYLPAGSRILDVKVNGKKLDKNSTYTLATVDFLANGGDGYTVLKYAKTVLDANSGPLLSTLIMDTIQQKKTITLKTDGRITVVNELPDDAFVDIKENRAASAILELKRNGIVKGMDGQHFRPDEPVTRAQFATMLALALRLPLDSTVSAPFADVKPTDWYFSSVRAAKDAGIVKGYPDATFHGDIPLTREHMSVMIKNVLMYKSKNPEAVKDLMNLVDTGSDVPTRADAALVVQQLLHLMTT